MKKTGMLRITMANDSGKDQALELSCKQCGSKIAAPYLGAGWKLDGEFLPCMCRPKKKANARRKKS